MDVPILRYVDVFIGLALVMLIGCSIVTALTQLATSSLYLRAQYLRQGLADMLGQLDPEWTAADRKYVAQLLVRHPMVARASTSLGMITSRIHDSWVAKGKANWLPTGAPADTVQRHEFLRILLEWSSGEGSLGSRPELEAVTSKVRAVLADNGIASPRETLHQVRYQVLAQERAYPDKPAHRWNTDALTDVCPSEFVGKVNSWFDAMSARTSQRFALQARLINSLISFIVVIALPLDGLSLIRKLSVDQKFREELVSRAQKKVEAATDSAEKAKAENAEKQVQAQVDELMSLNLPQDRSRERYPGFLLSWILLSLGAPFWYDALKNALRFRSLVAQKEEQDRKDRQTAEGTEGTRAAGAAASIAAGTISIAAVPILDDDERGNMDDVVAVG